MAGTFATLRRNAPKLRGYPAPGLFSSKAQRDKHAKIIAGLVKLGGDNKIISPVNFCGVSEIAALMKLAAGLQKQVEVFGRCCFTKTRSSTAVVRTALCFHWAK